MLFMGYLPVSFFLLQSIMPAAVAMERSVSCNNNKEELEHGADVNAQKRSGKVSLVHRAAYSGHMSVVNLFIKYGADPRLCDSDGQIPLHKVTMKLLWFEMTVGQSDLR